MSIDGHLLPIAGTKQSGNAMRTENVLAVCSVANLVKSSLGPFGFDKMIIDDIGDVTVTNDGAKILSMMDVQHPAAKILVELAQLQNDEVGDGTTSVVILAAELMKNGIELVKQNIHPTTIISGYRLACMEACKYISAHLTVPVKELPRDFLTRIAKTSLSSKIIGADIDFISTIVVDAIQAIKITERRYYPRYPIKAVNILKVHGKSSRESVLIPGYALYSSLASQQMPKKVVYAKIACLDFTLQKVRMKQGVEVLVDNPEKLQKIRAREMDIIKERIKKLLARGVNVVFCSGGIDDLCQKYFVKARVMAIRRVKKKDLLEVAKSTGAAFLRSLSDMYGEESFDRCMIGYAAEVSVERICDDELIIIKRPNARTAASIILRGPNDIYCDELERSIHDALCVLKRVLESNDVVIGGGSVETALSIYLDNFAVLLSSREQLAIAEFAKALLVIPKTLATNAGMNATDLIAKLRAYHNASQTKVDYVEFKWVGLDLMKGIVRDNKKAGVLEPAIIKAKSLKFATEAAITVLRVDDMIKLDAVEKDGNRTTSG